MGRWTDHAAYVHMVRGAKTVAGPDHALSGVLADRGLQDLGAAMHLNVLGKMGFYVRLV